MYGPLLSAGKSQPSQWALKKKQFSDAFFKRVVLAKAKPDVGLRDVAPAYWALALLRLVVAAAPQTGYIHPDEFFQTLEPVAGNIFDIEWSRSWEFNTTNPLRNMFVPQLSIGTPLKILKIVDELFKEYMNLTLITPYSLLVVPRIFFCALSFVNDFCLFKICHMYGENFNSRLIFMATSHVTLVYSTHTFSNSVEAVLLSVLLLAVSECMLTSGCVIRHNEALADEYDKTANIVERVKLFKLRKLLPEYKLRKCLPIAVVTIVGFFNRPTFAAFAFPSIFLWLFQGLGSKYVGLKDFHIRLFIFLTSCLLPLSLMIIIDSSYYGYLTLSDVESFEITINNFVVTPLNFVRYNLFADNLSNHGLHPRWLHSLVNMPILFNILAIIGFCSMIKVLYRLMKGHFAELPRIQSISGLMALSIIIPVGLLSVFPHQEPRFLIPVQLPLIFLCVQTPQLNANKKMNAKSFIFTVWCLSNVLLTIFFGFLHQGGIYPMAKHIYSEINAKPKFSTVHIVTNHMYNIPHSLLLTEDTSIVRVNKQTNQKYRLSKQLFLYELGSKPLDGVIKYTKVIWDVHESRLKINRQPFQLYVVFPSSLKGEFLTKWGQLNISSLILKEEASFFPHLSTEALPYFPGNNDPSCLSDFKYEPNVSWDLKLTLTERMFCFLQQFSLIMYKVEKYSNFIS